MSTFEEILSAALALPPGTRAMLAGHLLESLEVRIKGRSMLPGEKRLSDECARSTK